MAVCLMCLGVSQITLPVVKLLRKFPMAVDHHGCYIGWTLIINFDITNRSHSKCSSVVGHSGFVLSSINAKYLSIYKLA